MAVPRPKLKVSKKNRLRKKAATDSPVNVGDVVEISVPSIGELRTRLVRIARDLQVSSLCLTQTNLIRTIPPSDFKTADSGQA